jgi:putative transposase
MTSKIYPTDLSEAEWHRLSRLVPGPKPGGRPLKYPRRAILNAIFSLVRAGCPWRMLPSDLPPWRIVYHYFRLWTQSGWWQQLHDHLRGQLRVQEGRRPQPSAGILDSQSVKTASSTSERGFDAGKKVMGASGMSWWTRWDYVAVDGASGQCARPRRCLAPVGRVGYLLLGLRLIWADGGYAGALIEWVAQYRMGRASAPTRTLTLGGCQTK